MDNGRFERALERLLRADFSAGNDAFRDELLARCLAELGTDAGHGAKELDDADLDLLAAAGDVSLADGRPSGTQQDGGQASGQTGHPHLR